MECRCGSWRFLKVPDFRIATWQLIWSHRNFARWLSGNCYEATKIMHTRQEPWGTARNREEPKNGISGTARNYLHEIAILWAAQFLPSPAGCIVLSCQKQKYLQIWQKAKTWPYVGTESCQCWYSSCQYSSNVRQGWPSAFFRCQYIWLRVISVLGSAAVTIAAVIKDVVDIGLPNQNQSAKNGWNAWVRARWQNRNARSWSPRYWHRW